KADYASQLAKSSWASAGRIQLARHGPVLEDAIVVDRHGDEPDVAIEGGVLHRPVDGVEQAELCRPQGAAPGEPAFEEDSLGHTVPGDELHVPLEDDVVERLTKAAANEVRAKRLEDVLQRPGPGPLPDRIADADGARQHVR